MKDYEKRILNDSINIYCKRKHITDDIKQSLFNDLDSVEQFWNDKYKNEYIADKLFSEHFWKIMDDNFTESCILSLKMRYIDEKTYQQIADINGYSKTCAEQKVKKILEKLPKTKIWRVLLFNEIYRADLKTTIDSNNIYGTNLSNRCKTILVKYCNKNNLEPTISNIISNLSSLKELERIGTKSIKELFNWFNDNGYSEYVDIWKKTLPDKASIKQEMV